MNINQKSELLSLITHKLAGCHIDVTYSKTGRITARQIDKNPPGYCQGLKMIAPLPGGGERHLLRFPNTDMPNDNILEIRVMDSETIDMFVKCLKKLDKGAKDTAGSSVEP